MKKRLLIVVTFFIFMSVTLLDSINVFATESSNGEVEFNIQAIIPENQIDQTKSYFDLRMAPGEEQTIHLYINNTSENDNKYSISLNQAYTNKQGFIDYVDNQVEPDESLRFLINEIATYEETVEVPANSSYKYPITLKMPQEEFNGRIMAGIHVVEVDESDDTSKSGIQNTVGYVLGLNLTQNDQKVARELNLLEIFPAVSFGRNSIVARLQNPTMDAFGNLKYVVTISSVNGDTQEEIISKTFDSGMQLAPNSTYDFSIDWENQRMVPGDYKMNLVVTDALSNEWIFDEEFEITREESRKINEITIPGEKQKNNLIQYALIGVAIVVLVIFIIWIAKKNRKDDERSND